MAMGAQDTDDRLYGKSTLQMSVADEELFDAHAEASADWSWRHEDDFQFTTHLLNQNEELFRMKMTARGEDADGFGERRRSWSPSPKRSCWTAA